MPHLRHKAKQAFRLIFPIAILTVAVGGFVLLKKSKKPPASVTAVNRMPAVKAAAIGKHDGDIKIAVSGEVVPFREVNIAAEVPGRIAKKEPLCETGSFVRQGDVLFKIDDRDLKLEERRLRKELEQAQAFIQELDEEVEGTLRRLQVAGQEVASMRDEYDRQNKLRGVVSDSQVDKAKRDWLAAQNAEIQIRNQQQLLTARKLRLTSAAELVEVQLERATLDVQRTAITSPVTGVITSEHVQQDAYVQKGETLLTIEDTSQAEITCQLDAEDERWIWMSAPPEKLLMRLRAEDPADDYALPQTKAQVIYRRGEVECRWNGVLTRYDGLGFDPETRTIPCRVEVQEPRNESFQGENVGPRALARGMYVTVELSVTPKIFSLALGGTCVVSKVENMALVQGELSRLSGDVRRIDPEGKNSAVAKVVRKLDLLQTELSQSQTDLGQVSSDMQAIRVQLGNIGSNAQENDSQSAALIAEIESIIREAEKRFAQIEIGKTEHILVHGSRLYQFASPENASQFRGNPEKYALPPVALLRVPNVAIQPGNRIWTLVDSGRGKPADDKATPGGVGSGLVSGGVAAIPNTIRSLRKRAVQVVEAGPVQSIAFSADGTVQVGDLVVTSPLSNPRDGQEAILIQGTK